ncbi:MAG: hypothetical protein IAE81_23700 [Caldilineaceae bacterium]|nr:hypothetical protein [Caldilineaceae bacterium]
MHYQRMIFEDAPAAVEVPPVLRHRRVEVIMLALDAAENGANGVGASDQGWPADFVAQTAGQWAGAPLVREQPTTCETRLDLP